MKESSRNTALQTLKASENTELLNFLVEKQVRKSRNAVKSLLVHKQIRVNGRIVSQHDHELSVGDVVTVHKKTNIRDRKKLKGLTIVYEDEYLIVIDKEFGLLSVATEREKKETAYSVISEHIKLKNRDSRIFVLHRLDREMSGLMIFSKEIDIQQKFQKNWDLFVKDRSYIAVVEGQVAEEEGTIESWLVEDKNYVMHSSVRDNGGQKSITHFKRLKYTKRFSMLMLDLETSRKNQIRVHMKDIGHPIVGDKKYGSKINPIKRIALHAYSLNIVHPRTNELLEFKSPIPKKIQSLFVAE